MGKGSKAKAKSSNAATTSKNKKGSKPTNDEPSVFPASLLLDRQKKPVRLEELLPGYIWVLHDFFSPKECQAWIYYLETDVASRMELMQQRGTRYLAHRECHRFQADDPVMAHRLFVRLIAALKQQVGNADVTSILPSVPGHAPVTCNPNSRLYQYTKGMSFGRHIDESCRVPGVGDTRLTIVIYLSSCQGGATCFEHNVAFAPQVGALLLHVHGEDCLLHEAQAVEAGIKYVLRTDLVYGPS